MNNSHAMTDFSTSVGVIFAFIFAFATTHDIINAVMMGGLGYFGAQAARYLHNKTKPYLRKWKR